MEQFNFDQAEFDVWATEDKIDRLLFYYPEGLTEEQIEEKMINWYTGEQINELLIFGLMEEDREPNYRITAKGYEMLLDSLDNDE